MDSPSETSPSKKEADAPHVSRFRPQRNLRRWLILALLGTLWISIRLTQDAFSQPGAAAANDDLAHQECNIDRLEEVEYRVVSIDSPFKLTLAPWKPQTDLPETDKARVRLLGIRRPWQWSRNANQWEADTKQAIADWIADRPVLVRLSRRQISDDGMFLTHLCHEDELLSDFLVRQGWVTVDPEIDPSDGSIRRLYRAEDDARLAGRGIWSGRAMGMLDNPGL